MEFEKVVNLLTALMLYFIVILPFEGYVIMLAGDSWSMNTPIEGRENFQMDNLPFEKGQRFEFEISKPNIVGSLSYEIRKISKERILVNGIFTYYMIIQGKDGPTPMLDVPVTLKKSFWIDGRTFHAQSQDYVALLWNYYVKDSLANYGSDPVYAFGEDSSVSLFASPAQGENSDPILSGGTPKLQRVDLGYLTKPDQNSHMEGEKETIIL